MMTEAEKEIIENFSKSLKPYINRRLKSEIKLRGDGRIYDFMKIKEHVERWAIEENTTIFIQCCMTYCIEEYALYKFGHPDYDTTYETIFNTTELIKNEKDFFRKRH